MQTPDGRVHEVQRICENALRERNVPWAVASLQIKRAGNPRTAQPNPLIVQSLSFRRAEQKKPDEIRSDGGVRAGLNWKISISDRCSVGQMAFGQELFFRCGKGLEIVQRNHAATVAWGLTANKLVLSVRLVIPQTQ